MCVSESVTTESLDQDQDQDQDQTRRPQSDSSGSGADSCVAAQCVVLDGDHRGVIQRLLAQLFQEDQPPRSQDQPPDVQLVVSQLIFLSSQMTLVRSLVAERLNSSEPEGRLVACRTLCSLRGPFNKDVVHKLTHLMWSDPSERVRHAAADSLIKLGKEQNVHRHLRVKLEDGRGLQDRVEALKLISSLKLTTAKLLKSLVSCFKDESPAVRKQACVSAASLLLKDETVVSRLLELLENDPAREVRLSAIEAVGALGLSSADVQETLQSYVETEEDAELREAACRLLPVDNLHDFLLLDPECNGLVCRTITETLQEERCNAQLISLQVKRLCEGRIIADKVLLLEKLQNEKHKGRRLQRRVLCRLMSLLYRTDLYETPDDP
ncbi:HEAT repeat-containing protein 4 isoform X2 [Seriola aureovittata]|uniref:HEAT repeat-containing protein 4 isoform X2 n=1 Tax=Seriola aureovittata TaxID=2871759 RepID=UPI0024BDDC51|nr:HEAT repeat-containing protein 4 isoform X2 [Seriola aureovittata]